MLRRKPVAEQGGLRRRDTQKSARRGLNAGSWLSRTPVKDQGCWQQAARRELAARSDVQFMRNARHAARAGVASFPPSRLLSSSTVQAEADVLALIEFQEEHWPESCSANPVERVNARSSAALISPVSSLMTSYHLGAT
jgi:hypothetical protein